MNVCFYCVLCLVIFLDFYKFVFNNILFFFCGNNGNLIICKEEVVVMFYKWNYNIGMLVCVRYLFNCI